VLFELSMTGVPVVPTVGWMSPQPIEPALKAPSPSERCARIAPASELPTARASA